MRRLLIISFSNISQDARVLKQVREFSADWEVTTCSYGEKPAGADYHFTVPEEAVYWAYDRTGLILRNYRKTYWKNSAVTAAKQILEGGEWDVVLANDLDAVPLALSLNPTRGVHADLHEYAPREKDDLLRWKLFVGPFRKWMCKEYLPRCASITTVGAELAKEYTREFGVAVGVVMNATPYLDLSPSIVGSTVRVVHSGAGLEGRSLEVMIEAAEQSGANMTLDMYLTPNDPEYVQRLKHRFNKGERVTIHDPVPYDELIPLLNKYDVGVHILPPINFSHEWALPNKLFDFVQARLGIIVGPSPEMAAIVNSRQLGSVAEGFTVRDLVREFDRLSAGEVAAWKGSSAAAARELSAAPQNKRWRESLEALWSLQ